MSYYKNKIVLIGPYVGDFAYEIMGFKPFLDGFDLNFNPKDIFVSTHYNRLFLYPQYKTIPILRQYTNDEKGQEKHLHEKITAKDFQILKKIIIEDIVSISDYEKKDIVTYDLGYSSSPNKVSTQKIFRKVNIQPDTNKEIVFIPHESKSKKELKRVFNFLKENYKNVSLIGDIHKTKLVKYNELNLFNSEYNEMVYEYITKKILGSKCVITPCSHGTFFCNLHNIPVFSWGDQISLYKTTYNFNNRDYMIIYTNKKRDKIFFRILKKFLDKY